MSRLGSLGHQLYTGEISYDFVGRRKLWYTISAVLLAGLDRCRSRSADSTSASSSRAATSSRSRRRPARCSRRATRPTSVGATQIEVTELRAESGRSLQVQTESLSSRRRPDGSPTALAEKFGVDPTRRHGAADLAVLGR